MKKALIVFFSLLVLASCRKKEEESAPVAVTSITILPENPVVIAGATTTLRATVLPADAAQAVTWRSEDKSKATIDPATGVVSGVAAGTTTIIATATDGSGITGKTTLTVKSSGATVASITLGAENFKVEVPAPGAVTTLNNAPRVIASNLTEVPVNITIADGATLTTGGTPFTSEGNANTFKGNANFTNPVVFTVTAKDGTTTKTYTVSITAYNASTNPYGVYTVAHLNDVRNEKKGSYKLMNTITLPNIDAEGVNVTTGIDDYADAGWLPITHDASGGAYMTNGFSGTFDGAGFSIENLYIKRTTSVCGLFGGGSSCTIKNLAVRGTTTKTSVTVTAATANQRFLYAGILIGSINGGTITDCSATGDVSSAAGMAGGLAGNSSGETVISNCFATGNVKVGSGSGSGEAGGLIGFCRDTKISKSYATGNVTGEYRAGGLVAAINSRSITESSGITDCFATGNVSGGAGEGAAGLAGSNLLSLVTNSYATGNVSSTGSYAGSLVGRNVKNAEGKFVNCYRNSGAEIKKDDAPVTPTDDSTDGITPKTKAYMQTDDFKGNLNGTGTIWGRDDTRNDKLPYIIGVGVGK